jgi:hypothetical protein
MSNVSAHVPTRRIVAITDSDPALADDLLIGAEQIAQFVFGDRKMRRRIYHLLSSSRMPHARLGGRLCVRKSAILQWLIAQEQRR